MKVGVHTAPSLRFNSTKTGTWREVAMGIKPERRRALQFYDPFNINKMKVTLIGEDTFNRGGSFWVNSVVMYVVGPRPMYLHFKAYATRTWKPKGDFEIYTRDNGFYLIKFKLEEDMNKVLTGDPYFFDGRIIMIKKWSPEINLDRDLLISIPIWVRLFDINLNLLDEEALGRMTSVLGTRIEMDNITANQKRISYARVLVEMKADSDFPSEIPIALFDGDLIWQKVGYEWIPPKCERCMCFGHYLKQCPMQSIWKAKVSVSSEGLDGNKKYRPMQANVPGPTQTNNGNKSKHLALLWRLCPKPIR